ncbi:MAG TPA: alpha/beta fold hydrolase [Candidatus Thermoplasmatota archaeon]|nr:alpha/beta fold hydrolase [Candidatus Thermoplasmatota archaeon]
MSDDRVVERDEPIACEDGFTIAATRFEPPANAPPRPAVVVDAATAVKRSHYRAFARHLAARGFPVLTFDYRGIGGSRPASLRGFPATMRDWAERDIPAAIRAHRAAHPGRPLAVVGHSAGGWLLGLSPAAREVDAAVLVASQSGWWGHWPRPARWKYALVWHAVLPALVAAFGRAPGWAGLGTDLPAGVAREWAAWCRDPAFVGREPAERREGFRNLAAPVLAYGFEDDDYAPPASVDALLAMFERAEVERRSIAPADLGLEAIGHFGFFRETVGGALWDDVARWIAERAK